MPSTIQWLSIAALSLAAAGCTENEAKPEKPASPAAASSAPAPTPAAAPAKAPSMDAKKLGVVTAGSKVDFLMEAPQEKIVGHAPNSASGELQIDFMDLTKSTGTLAVDISGLEIFQAKPDKDGKFGSETKSDAQNEHAKNWLEISKDAPEKDRQENSKIVFTIKSIEAAGEKNLTKLTGAERKVMLKVTGDFTLHKKTVEKVAELEATFKMDGDKPVSVAIKTTKPITVGLAEHDVKPRDGFGKLAARTLEVLAPKVNKEALVSLDLTAKVP
jgi:hypothetical protein